MIIPSNNGALVPNVLMARFIVSVSFVALKDEHDGCFRAEAVSQFDYLEEHRSNAGSGHPAHILRRLPNGITCLVSSLVADNAVCMGGEAEW